MSSRRKNWAKLATIALLGEALVASCAPGPSRRERIPISEWVRPIIGGTSDSSDPSVIALVSLDMGEYYLDCTGTLIAPKTVLTAAHCVSPQYTEFVFIGSDFSRMSPSQLIPTVQGIPHPSFNEQLPNTDAYDIGVFQLAQAPALTPIPLYDRPITVGLPIRHVGFGATVGTETPNDGSGLKREMITTIRRVEGQIEIGAPGKSHCYGDSGGPGFVVAPGETQERVEGVVSWGPGDCDSESWDTRVDMHLAWLSATIRPWDRLPQPSAPMAPGKPPADPPPAPGHGPGDSAAPTSPGPGLSSDPMRAGGNPDSGEDMNTHQDESSDLNVEGGCRAVSGQPDLLLFIFGLSVALVVARRRRT